MIFLGEENIPFFFFLNTANSVNKVERLLDWKLNHLLCLNLTVIFSLLSSFPPFFLSLTLLSSEFPVSPSSFLDASSPSVELHGCQQHCDGVSGALCGGI